MSESPLVTIAIPTYNRANLVAKSLVSAIGQTFADIEIIVSNNASNDSTDLVLSSLGLDPRIRIYTQKENIGMVPNWNFCLNQARGKFFLLLSDDDILESNAVETLLNAFDSDQIGAVCGNTLIRSLTNGSSRLVNYPLKSRTAFTVGEFMIQCTLGKITAFPSSTMYLTRDLITSNGYHNTGAASDFVSLFCVLQSKMLCYTPEAVSVFLDHSESTSANGAGTLGGYKSIIVWAARRIKSLLFLLVYALKNLILYKAIILKGKLSL